MKISFFLLSLVAVAVAVPAPAPAPGTLSNTEVLEKRQGCGVYGGPSFLFALPPMWKPVWLAVGVVQKRAV
ncbi:hypothetical protein BJY04DRAFT_217522 [Aspergillus karnatakaensis]|uniref:uncharacterized protein n=1 Tax=Aspergillus karnatakaensis TaxID=1810916 RepID=UPI003CCCABEE